MACNPTPILHRPIDHGILQEIYSADQEIYPAPLPFERLKSWVSKNPELSLYFYTNTDGNNASTSVGAIIVLPILERHWQELLTGRLKEFNIDSSTMFPLQEPGKTQAVGLHIFHIEKFSGAMSFSGRRRFSEFALSTIQEIASANQWNILGYSGLKPSALALLALIYLTALTATAAGRRTFERMGFLSTGYEELFIQTGLDGSSHEMMCIYPQASESQNLPTRGPVLSRSQMTVKYGDIGF